MPSPYLSPTAVMVLRAWREEHPLTGLRAVVTRVDDVDENAAVDLSAKSVDEVCAHVRDWLQALLTYDNCGLETGEHPEPKPGPR